MLYADHPKDIFGKRGSQDELQDFSHFSYQ